MRNGEALELILDSLPVRPNEAQVALGRRLAQLVDEEDTTAAMVHEYRLWLAEIEGAVPVEPDELDKAQ